MEDVRDLGYIDLHTNVGEQKNEWDNEIYVMKSPIFGTKFSVY